MKNEIRVQFLPLQNVSIILKYDHLFYLFIFWGEGGPIKSIIKHYKRIKNTINIVYNSTVYMSICESNQHLSLWVQPDCSQTKFLVSK